MKTVLELRRTDCRWPSGDGPIVFECTDRAIEGKSYCATHYARSCGTRRVEPPVEIVETSETDDRDFVAVVVKEGA